MQSSITAVAGPTAAPIFHLHPLLRCNLRCLHCYSDSSPQEAAALPLDSALGALDMAAAWGYGVLAVSGGEPLLYPGLARLLAHAQSLGMSRSVVTNGLLLDHGDAMSALRLASSVTVSIDGLAANHDRMRARHGAFEGAARAVRRLADAGIETWISCGITAANIDEIDAVVEHAICWGARGVNFHPVESAGRAGALPADALLGEDDRVLLFAAAALLDAANRDRLEVHVDLMHRSAVLRHPQLMYAGDLAPGDGAVPARMLGVLVMSADGALVPVCYGFDRSFGLGRVNAGTAFDADAAWRRFSAATYPRLRRLAGTLLRELADDPQLVVLNPSEWLAARSHAFAPPQPLVRAAPGR